MNNLLDQLAGILDTEVNSEIEQEIETIAQAAQEMLVANMVRWFSLPPVLSAWRIKKAQYCMNSCLWSPIWIWIWNEANYSPALHLWVF